jgi:hypothetical protein
MALTRSQRCFGTMSGKMLRTPVMLRMPVSDATATISTSSGGGRLPVSARMPTSDRATSVTR